MIYLFCLCFWITTLYGMHTDFDTFFRTSFEQNYRSLKLKYAYDGNWTALRALSTEIQTQKLLAEAATGNWNAVKTIFRKNRKVDLNAYTSSYYFPLLYAVQEGNYDSTSFLLERGAQANRLFHARRQSASPKKGISHYNCYDDGKTALFDAVQDDNLRMVNLLLDWEASVCLKNGAGQTPLLVALSADEYTQSTFKIVSILLVAASNANVQEHIIIINNSNGQHKYGGQTALIKAAQKSPSMVALLLEQGACNVKAQDVHKKTANDYAIEAGFVQTAMALQNTAQDKEFPQPRTLIINDMLSW